MTKKELDKYNKAFRRSRSRFWSDIRYVNNSKSTAAIVHLFCNLETHRGAALALKNTVCYVDNSQYKAMRDEALAGPKGILP